MKTVTLLILIILQSLAVPLCDMSLDGGLCLFGGKTALLPRSVPKGLVGHWTFDDDSCLDYSGNSNHCLSPVSSGPSRTSKGFSAGFSGTDLLEIPNSASFQSKIFTITFWVFFPKQSADTGLPWCPLLQKGLDAKGSMQFDRAPAVYYDRVNKFLKVYISTDNIVKYPQGESLVSNARIPYYKWAHVGIVRTQSRIRIYVNGIIDAVGSTDGWTELNSGSLFVGNTPWTVKDCPVRFSLDDLRWYDNREVTEAEIEAEAFGALGPIEPYYIRLSCINCPYSLAAASCPDTHRMCTSIELHTAGYAVARAMGWTDWNSHIWSTATVQTSDETLGLGICCLNLD